MFDTHAKYVSFGDVGTDTKSRLAAIQRTFPFKKVVEPWLPNEKRDWEWDQSGRP